MITMPPESVTNHDRLILGMRELPHSHTPQELRWGIPHTDRRNHLYIIGKTGTGKTTLLRNILIQDIARGAGVGLLDPHGDLAEDILDHIPKHRTDDVVYFNPQDLDYPLAWNLVKTIPLDDRPLVAEALVDAFKSIFAESWGPRLQWILANAIRACLDADNTTLLDVYRMLVDEPCRRGIVAQVKDPIVASFWQCEFEQWPQHVRFEAIAPVQNKLGRFLQNPAARNMLGQTSGKFDLGFMMDHERIFIANLSKGVLGPDQANLLGSLLIAQIQAAALRRATMPEHARKDFYLVIDEFQNFMTDSFASILSEARKYRLNLTMANQYLDQLRPTLREAILGNVGSLISFRVGGPDAETLEAMFRPDMARVHFSNLHKYEVIARMQHTGLPGNPFRGTTLPPIENPHKHKRSIIKTSRMRYCRPRAFVEERITTLFPTPHT